MTKPEAVKDAAIQRIGCPYVMGGTGKTCTPQYREARMAQYPKYADLIRKNCPRLKGSASTCKNCRWCDPETGKGKLCYDCAQFALACMAAAGIPLVSGANSQWLKTRFSESGEISGLPSDKVCLVFRKDSDGKMHHVAVYMGDGTVVHARGHDYGVVRQRIEEVSKPFTHYGVPAGLYDNELPTLRKGNSGAYVKMMQQALADAGYTIGIDGKFGSKTEDVVKAFQKANGLTADGVCGPKTWKALEQYIKPELPDDPEPPWVDDDPVDDPEGTVVVDRDELVDMLNQIEAMRDKLNSLAHTARDWIGGGS